MSKYVSDMNDLSVILPESSELLSFKLEKEYATNYLACNLENASEELVKDTRLMRTYTYVIDANKITLIYDGKTNTWFTNCLFNYNFYEIEDIRAIKIFDYHRLL